MVEQDLSSWNIANRAEHLVSLFEDEQTAEGAGSLLRSSVNIRNNSEAILIIQAWLTVRWLAGCIRHCEIVPETTQLNPTQTNHPLKGSRIGEW